MRIVLSMVYGLTDDSIASLSNNFNYLDVDLNFGYTHENLFDYSI